MPSKDAGIDTITVDLKNEAAFKFLVRWCKERDMKLARAGVHIARVDGANKRLEAEVVRCRKAMDFMRAKLGKERIALWDEEHHDNTN